MATPSAIPQPTPNDTAYISVDLRKEPLVRFSTVIPSALSAGSARVAPNPSTQAKATAMNSPNAKLYSGDALTRSSRVNAAGTSPPDWPPSFASP